MKGLKNLTERSIGSSVKYINISWFSSFNIYQNKHLETFISTAFSNEALVGTNQLAGRQYLYCVTNPLYSIWHNNANE